MGEGEDGAEIIIVKKPFLPRRGKRKPLIPNRNRIDRIEIVSQSDVHVEVKCRFLYKGSQPKKNVQIRIPLPKRDSIINNIKRTHPKIRSEQLNHSVNSWIHSYINNKIKHHWKKHKLSQQILSIDEDIGEID